MTTNALHIEGNLISADLLPDMMTGEIKGQQAQDFGFKANDKLEDEIAFVWSEAKSRWAIFQGRLARLADEDSATSLTREYWAMPLLELLGYQPSYQGKAEVIDNQTFAVSHRAGLGGVGSSEVGIRETEQSTPHSPFPIPSETPPVHVIGCRLSLEKRPPSGTPRLSAHGLVQEFLNRTEHLWGITTNGYQWRLLRDCSLMTRLAYIEFDLEQIFNNENFAEFRLFYRLFHRSRLPEGMEDGDKCLLEHYYQETLSQGGRVRDNLRDGVEDALKILGNGFLQHPKSEGLRQALGLENELGNELGNREWAIGNSSSSTSDQSTPYSPLSTPSFYRQLLMLIYRCLFLMVAESRNLLLAGEDAEKIEIYNQYYSFTRLRELADRPNYRREGFEDLWQGLQVTFSLFDESWRGEILGLSPLNGDLFGSKTLAQMADYSIDNHDLLKAIRGLSLYDSKGQLRRVNYAALDVEELGSVYESLLDFTPQITVTNGIYQFDLVTGSDRKTTGSYYTPSELVAQLIKSALEPVIENALTLALSNNASIQSGNTALTPSPSPKGRGEPDKWEISPELAAKMKVVARDLRKSSTPTEAILWQALRNRQLNNSKFRRQHPIGPFVVDFYCHEAGLIVEVDGSIHDLPEQKTLDHQRQELLESLGLRFLRISNQAIETNLSKVLQTIQQALLLPSTLLPPSPTGRGAGGEGKTLTTLKEAGDEGLKTAQEAALLSLKICDPACGSGHFLLAAARRVGKELARVRTGEIQPSPEPLRQAIRDVIQHCIYGVDLNPLAVDLCKVALWIEGFCKGMPLNFLDHRIKCGNSLVGVMDLEVLKEGIPDNAYTAVTGDDKALATKLKKSNKEQCKVPKGQLSLFEDIDFDVRQGVYAKGAQDLDTIEEVTPEGYKRKQQRYEALRSDGQWWQDYSACNLWTAAFFMPLTEQNLQLLPTTEALRRLLKEAEQREQRDRGGQGSLFESRETSRSTPFGVVQIVEAAKKLGDNHHFFHWCLEFPEVFEKGGFDCVLGNPPWERIKLQEKEFFGSRDSEIATAQNKAEREKLIKTLPERKPELARAFQEAKHEAEAQSKFIRESKRFPLTAVGDINTYAIFAETVREIINQQGRTGVIVPTGIATDNTTKDFFGDLIKKQNLASLYDFENREAIFSGVHRSYKFALLVVSRNKIQETQFSFFLTQPKQLEDKRRVFTLSPQDIALINPNTLTCPVFRTKTDADITKKIYQRVPVLENEATRVNPLEISFIRMFDMANDSHLFKTEPREDLLPLYEAKMFHQFDHRWATYKEADCRDVILEEKNDPDFYVNPRYWIDKIEVENRLNSRWNKKWLLGFRDITGSVNERTALFSLLPKLAVGHTAPIIILNIEKIYLFSCFLANINSLVFDFIVRQKINGNHLTFTLVRQLPIIPPESYSPQDIEFISKRVLELTYTAYDLKPFAEDLWRELGNSEWGIGLRREIIYNWQKQHGKSVSTELQRLISMARGNESSRDELSTDSSISQGRDLRNDIANSESSSLDSRQHSGGIRQGESGGIYSISENSSGFTQGTGDPSNSFRKSQNYPTSTDQSSTNQSRNPWEDATFFDSQTPEQQVEILITTPHSPLPIPPFIWDENRRAILRAELDAKYAKLYGLTREELRYILDPADVYGPDFPSETFRVLKNNEIKKYGEYRTQKLVLAAWDMMGY